MRRVSIQEVYSKFPGVGEPTLYGTQIEYIPGLPVRAMEALWGLRHVIRNTAVEIAFDLAPQDFDTVQQSGTGDTPQWQL